MKGEVGLKKSEKINYTTDCNFFVQNLNVKLGLLGA